MTEEKELPQEEIKEEVSQEQTQEVVEQKDPIQEPKREDLNWKRANEVLKLQKQRIDELESKLTQSQKQPEPEKDEFDDLDPDDYLTVSKARKLAEKLSEKKAKETAKQIVEEYVQQQNVQNDEQRARTKYEDYDYVIENYAIPLIKNDPALAHKIQTSKNPAETAYKLGKLSDEYEETTMKQQTSPKAEKIIKNTSRPVSSAAVGSTLKNQADQFSKMSPQQVWEMSQKYARGA